MSTSLISEEYRRLQEDLHGDPFYGVASVRYAPLVADYIRRNDVRQVLDYGAGKGRLGEELDWLVPWPLEMRRYDPGVPQFSARPGPAEFVACIDVLEHIEPHLLGNVLDDLRRVTQRSGLFTVHTGAAGKVLADGRNAHLIQQPPEWWLPHFMQRFELQRFTVMPFGFWVAVNARPT
ncbi:MAG TPA: hypothetical protein VG873_18860 [Burkholderiales bacterium]|nr:hypothetical protein [Burkholderiales bacterium]